MLEVVEESIMENTMQEPLLLGERTDEEKDIELPNPFFYCCGGDASTEDVVEIRSRFRLNHNVFLTLLLSILYAIAESLWDGTVNAAYLKKLANGSNSPMGNIEAVNGLASLISALPVGYLADKWGRSKVISAGGVCTIVTAVLHITLIAWIGTGQDKNDNDNGTNNNDNSTSVDDDAYALLVESTSAYPVHNHAGLVCMGIIMALWGICNGIVNGPSQALFADSIPEGKRSDYFAYMFACFVCSSAVGPAVSIFFFQTVGDEWSMKHLQLILYVGLGLNVAAASVMFFFDDSKALDEDQLLVDNQQQQAPLLPDGLSSPIRSVRSGSDYGVNGEDESVTVDPHSPTSPPRRSPIVPPEEVFTNPDQVTPVAARVGPTARFVPYILFIHSLIMSIGSGMTVKFFPLFFKDDVGLSPSQVQGIYLMVPLVMSLLGGLCTKAARWIGRVPACLVFKVAGILLLFSMVAGKKFLDVHPVVLVPIYIGRTALMNATYPVEESLLMDFVHSSSRARWKSLESVSVFGWCGSAALGGWLADKYDYTYTFGVTVALQGLATVLMAILLYIVPLFENPDDNVILSVDEFDTGRSTTTSPRRLHPSLERAIQSGPSDQIANES